MAKKKPKDKIPMPKKGKCYEAAKLLLDGKWQCRICAIKHTGTAQYAGSGGIKRLKGEFGWEIETHGSHPEHTGPARFCKKCKGKTTHDRFTGKFVPNPKNEAKLSDKVKKRIRDVLGPNDAIFNQPINEKVCYEHKSPGVRWPSGEQPHGDDISDDEIKSTFQLYPDESWNRKKDLSGCRPCFLNKGEKGRVPANGWPEDIPEKGPKSVEGCKGCFWYDTSKYLKENLNNEEERTKFLNKLEEQLSKLYEDYEEEMKAISESYESTMDEIDQEYEDGMKKLDRQGKERKKRFSKRVIWTTLLILLPGTLLSLYYNHIAPFIGATFLTFFAHFYYE